VLHEDEKRDFERQRAEIELQLAEEQAAQDRLNEQIRSQQERIGALEQEIEALRSLSGEVEPLRS
jgi:hypothetical protein